MGAPVVELRGVQKRFGGRTVLENLSFAIAPGEAVGYLGPNGAGKSTTLRLLSGLLAPDRGEVRLGGFDPIADRTRALAGVGALVETPALPPYLTPRDLLGHVARLRGFSGPSTAAAAARAGARLGIAPSLDRPYGTLSTGLQRRALLAAAAVGEPPLLLLDEPTLGLDPAARGDLRRLLRAVADSGTTLFLSTHLLEDVEAVCDRVLFLKEGRLVGDEAVGSRRDPVGRRRRVDLTFAEELPDPALALLAAPDADCRRLSPRSVRVEFDGGSAAQAALVARAVRAGLPLESIGPAEGDLARRYLERVGREEAT